MVSLIHIMFRIMIFLWILPSGSIMGFPIKMIIFIICFGLVLIDGLFGGKTLKSSSGVKYLMIIAIAIPIWGLISVINGYGDGLISILKSIFSLIGIVVLADLYMNNYADEYEIKRIINLFWISTIIFIAFKFLIEILFISGVLSYNECRNIFINILDAEIMTAEVQFGSLLISRLGTANDTIPFIVLSIDLVCEKRGIIQRIIMIAVSVLYTFVVFSRVIVVQLAVTFIFSIIWMMKKYKFTKKLVFNTILFVVAFIIPITIIIQKSPVYNNVLLFIQFRFSSNLVDYSDQIRMVQFEYLMSGFEKHILIGNGLGSYVKEYIRSSINIYSYELEYLSFLYQLGIVGFIVIILPLWVFTYKLTIKKSTVKGTKIIIGFNYFIWLLKPLFNPHLLSSTSGMSIVALYLFAIYYNKINYNDIETNYKIISFKH